jgi:hypothetical protein
MELKMNEWNVYKVFANGKRAKSPHTTFSAKESSHFFENILPTLTAKQQKTSWVVIDSQASQERPVEKIDEEAELMVKKIQTVLKIRASEKYPDLMERKVIGALMMSKDTDWKWAWCLVQPATHNFIAMVSETFEKRKEATAWIPAEYQKMVGIQPTE